MVKFQGHETASDGHGRCASGLQLLLVEHELVEDILLDISLDLHG